MFAIFNLPPKYCPFCGNEIPETSTTQVGDKVVQGCNNCGLLFQVGSSKTFETVWIYSDASQKFRSLELVIAGNPNTSSKGLLTRDLLIDNIWEVALIIPRNFSIDQYREGLSEIKTHASILYSEMPGKPELSMSMYYEYENLRKTANWTYKMIAEQILFDCYACLLLQTDTEASEDLKSFGSIFFHALMMLSRKRPSKIPTIMQNALELIKHGESPWMLDGDFITNMSIKDAFKAWKRDAKNSNSVEGYPFILAAFWSKLMDLSFWKKTEEHLKVNGYKYTMDDYFRHLACLLEISRFLGSSSITP